mmetsp:Transcript_36859/g.102291  ORF Transcript_36859/g.102291 Transcript_36859/m.102291 type:complete len:81 (+) Transcript_36859:1135-1377(+)
MWRPKPGHGVSRPYWELSSQTDAPGFTVSVTMPRGLAQETPGPNMWLQGRKPTHEDLQEASGMKGPLPAHGTMKTQRFRT